MRKIIKFYHRFLGKLLHTFASLPTSGQQVASALAACPKLLTSLEKLLIACNKLDGKIRLVARFVQTTLRQT